MVDSISECVASQRHGRDPAHLPRCGESPGQHLSPVSSWSSLCLLGQNSLVLQTQASLEEVPYCTFLFKCSVLGIYLSMEAVFQGHRPGSITLGLHVDLTHKGLVQPSGNKQRCVPSLRWLKKLRHFSRSSLSQVKTKQTRATALHTLWVPLPRQKALPRPTVKASGCLTFQRWCPPRTQQHTLVTLSIHS